MQKLIAPWRWPDCWPAAPFMRPNPHSLLTGRVCR